MRHGIDREEGVFGAGDGVARDLALVDWSATPLGAPEGWSRALRTVVRVILGSRFSMWMAWGPELTFFCNDAYRRDTLGRKYPWALGRPAREVWEEIWPDIGPRIDAVLTTGEATWDESLRLFLERSGYREETYHTFSYSPLWDDDDTIRGMLCVVTEETERVIGVRRMATLRDLGAVVTSGGDERAFLRAALASLAVNPWSLPFAAVYLFDDGGDARLAATLGIDAGHPAVPERIAPGEAEAPWPAAAAAREMLSVAGLRERFDSLPRGPWDDPPDVALLAPLPGAAAGDPYGFLLVGTNPYRLVDADYRGFIELIAQRLASGITSVRGLASERERAEALAELDRARAVFFSNVSHEFRTPLTLIAGPTEEALADPDEPPAGRERWEVVRRNAGRLRRLVDDMLDFSRIEAGVLQPQRVPVDLAALTADIVASFAPAVERAGLALETEIEPLPGPVRVDPEMWEKVTLNLLSNAVKYTPQGTVAVRLALDEDRVALSVSDTGIGVAEHEQPLLFNRFHRVRDAGGRSHEGAGIGLALVQELARLHGGVAEVSSRLGHGSTFTVAIPHDEHAAAEPAPIVRADTPLAARYREEAMQWEGAPEAVGAEEDAAERVAAGSTLLDGTVLVIDDNVDLRRFVARLLAPHWTVLQAADGLTGLELARAHQPDLVLTDVMMPGLDGLELLAALRADPGLRTTPVVLLSARAGEEAAVSGLQAGADDYLMKPFAPQELIARVRANMLLARLRNRESAFRTALVNALPEGIALADRGGAVIEVNDGFLALTGYGRDGVPYDAPHPWIAPGERADTGLPEALTLRPHERLVRARHRDGRELWLAMTETAVGDGAPGGDLTAITVRDVTAQHEAARKEALVEGLMAGQAGVSNLVSVLSRALEVLRETLAAPRAWALQWSEVGDSGPQVLAGGGDPFPPGAGPDLERARAQPAPSVTTIAADGGAGAVVLTLDRDLAAWVELDPPRPLDEHEDAMLGRIASYLSLASARIRREETARAATLTLQHAMLGEPRLPLGFAARYQAAVSPLEVGGDWYDVTVLDEHTVGVVVGDCVGRGLAAAAVMGRLRSACQALLLTTVEPAEVLTALDRVAAHVDGAFAATAFCAVIDTDEGSVRYSCAGHVPGVLAHADGTSLLLDEARSVPLGVTGGRPRPQGSQPLASGATVLLITDGLIERRGEPLDEGLDRVRAVAGAHATASPDTVADLLMRTQEPPGGFTDDIAIVLYRHPPPPLRLALPAQPERLAGLRRDLRTWLASAGIAGARADEVVLAIGEAAANTSEHAGGSASMSVTAALRSSLLAIEVSDDGRWKPAVADPARGRGLPIIRAMMDEVAVTHDDAGTRVRMTKRLAP